MFTRAQSYPPVAMRTGNAEKCVAFRAYIGNSSPLALLSCPAAFLCMCVCVCASWNASVFYEGISYHHSLLCSRVHGWKCHHEIWQQSSFKSNNVVKNNGNKEAQSLMVMRLYFRAVAASVWNSDLFSVVVRQKMSAWTGGCFSQAGKESLVTLASALHLFAADHLSRVDSVNVPQPSFTVYICITAAKLYNGRKFKADFGVVYFSYIWSFLISVLKWWVHCPWGINKLNRLIDIKLKKISALVVNILSLLFLVDFGGVCMFVILLNWLT